VRQLCGLAPESAEAFAHMLGLKVSIFELLFAGSIQEFQPYVSTLQIVVQKAWMVG
jgi:hypothetical protein